jgi:hypothetical protein
MHRYLMTTAAAAAAGALLLAGSPAWAGTQAAGAVTSGWGTAKELPGSAALNADGRAGIISVSCTSPGDCTAGGNYIDSSGHQQVMVDTETNGTWGTAEELPGIATLDAGAGSEILSVSCASPGNCSAGGDYSTSPGVGQAWVASESGGAWGDAIEVPGTGALNVGGDARVYSVSCTSPGDCSAGGQYDDGEGFFQAFVATESGGTWSTAIEVPGSGKLNTAGDALIYSVSCASAGNCSAGGYYVKYSGFLALEEAFVVSEAGGSWGNAKEVPGTARLNTGGLAVVDSVSCTAVGDCSAGGSYDDSAGHYHAFVVSQVSGTWGTAEQIPGTVGLDKDNAIQVYSVSCASAGNCSLGGYYTDASGDAQAFVDSQVSGTWGKAKEVPGTAALNKGTFALVRSVSCASPGDCSIGGYYTDGSSHYQAFVDSQTSGTWAEAKEVPGTATLNKGGDASVPSVSCASAGNCGAGGSYTDSSGHSQAFVVGQTSS